MVDENNYRNQIQPDFICSEFLSDLFPFYPTKDENVA